MEVLKQIKEDIQCYRKKGDNSLEYIGITVNNTRVKEYKCYRFKTKTSKIEKNLFSTYDFLKKLDYQKNMETGISRMAYKVDFSNYDERSVDEILEKGLNEIIDDTGCSGFAVGEILQLNQYIKETIKTQQEPLCVIGGKVDKNEKIQELKTYYQLRIFSKEKRIKSSLAEKEAYFHIIDYLGEICDMKKRNIENLKEIFDISMDNFFESMMIGIDFDLEIQKVKYYFVKNSKEKINYKNNKLTKEFIQKIENYGLILKGFAVSFCNHNDEWNINFYFCEV